MENVNPVPAPRLNDVIDSVVRTLLPRAAVNKTFFVNDIPDHFKLGNNSQLVATVIGGLLSTVASHAKDSCVWLSARLYGNVVLVHVKNSKSFNCEGIEGQLQPLQLLAERTRGSVGFTSHQSNITSLTFGFAN